MFSNALWSLAFLYLHAITDKAAISLPPNPAMITSIVTILVSMLPKSKKIEVDINIII